MINIIHYKYSGKMRWSTETGTVSLKNRHNIEFLDEELERYEAETILGVIEIDDNSYLVMVKKSESIGLYEGNEIFKILKVEFIPIIICSHTENVTYLKQFIQTYDFYFTKNKFMEERFIWNMHMIDRLKTGEGEWRVFHYPERQDPDFGYSYMFCGFFVSKFFKVFDDFYVIKLLSLVCSRKMGTRFLSRGLDVDGNVSFFVKTHFSVRKNNRTLFNLNILRGSVPLFWKQKTHGINGRVFILDDEEALDNAFDKHFELLKEEYGNIHVLTLLGERKDEKLLNTMYIKMLKEKNIAFTDFDLNSFTSNFENLKKSFFEKLNKCESNVTYRVNCVDCLDRTNLAQYLICKYKVEKIIQNHTLNKLMQECWTDNGHSLSNLYTGSDVMKSDLSLNQKRSIFGVVDDIFISATRLINNRFTDKQKNKIINILMGKDKKEDRDDM